VVRAGLRLLEDQEAERRRRVEEIRRSIEEGRRDGRSTPADQVFDRLEAKYDAMSAEHEGRGMP
jgi:antitoxin ParD1/3/4